jgi:hypothetical protein
LRKNQTSHRWLCFVSDHRCRKTLVSCIQVFLITIFDKSTCCRSCFIYVLMFVSLPHYSYKIIDLIFMLSMFYMINIQLIPTSGIRAGLHVWFIRICDVNNFVRTLVFLRFYTWLMRFYILFRKFSSHIFHKIFNFVYWHDLLG